MCIITGYVGSKQAAPILIDMMRKAEGLDGGHYTGIATIHDGIMHYRKLEGYLYKSNSEEPGRFFAVF